MNPASSTLVGLYKSVVSNELTKQHFDAIFDDGPDDFLYLSGTPCNFVPSAWLNAYVAEVKAVGHPVIYNGLGNEGPNGAISSTIGMNAGTVGGEAENCYSTRFGTHMLYGAHWGGMENTEIAMEKQNKMFICYSMDLASASTSIPVRLYVYASFLLTYNVSTTMLWEYFSTTSGYTVEPESQLVALSPWIETPSSIASGLLTSTGAYARRYSACYLGGTYVGPCAAVVNSDNVNSHAFPYTMFHHTLLLSGGGILDGGTVSTKGPAPPSMLAPLTGVIAFE